jgi:uncharacterized protein YlxW (UPF0749 family)
MIHSSTIVRFIASSIAELPLLLLHGMRANAFVCYLLQLCLAEEKYKKALGEVECQRHNADAARQALEHKLREADKTQKAELASLTDTIRDMQKHMDDAAAKATMELKKVKNPGENPCLIHV